MSTTASSEDYVMLNNKIKEVKRELQDEHLKRLEVEKERDKVLETCRDLATKLVFLHDKIPRDEDTSRSINIVLPNPTPDMLKSPYYTKYKEMMIDLIQTIKSQ